MGKKGKSRRFWLMSGITLAVLFGAVGLVTTHYVVQSQIESFADRFLLLSSLRKQALENYFDTARAEITFWSLNEELLTKQSRLVKGWDRYRKTRGDPGAKLQQVYIQENPHPHGKRHELNDAGDGSAYSAMHAELHPLSKLFVVERGYYDFFLIGPKGDIFYTVEKEADFGTNLLHGPWHKSGLADVFRRALASADRGTVVFSDLESYGPSAGAPAMFMAKAMLGEQGQVIGVLAFQLPTDHIKTIMQFTAGMGESGETYLVGEDRLMRSDSRFSDESSILKVKVDTDSVRQALADESGTMITEDYRGVPVLSAFNTITVDQFRWAVMAEIDRDEVVRTLANKRPLIAGLLLFLYSLAMWSFWYIRPGDWSESEGLAGLAIESDHSDVTG
jgi:methyl-accepting chemotaxis protein